MINRKILLMILFSFSAHLALAAVIVYTPYEVIGNSLASHHERVIWGYLEEVEKSAKDGENPVRHPELASGSQMMQGQEIPKQVQNDVKDDRNNNIEAVFSDETPISLDSQRMMKIPLDPPFSKGENSFPPLEKGGKGGFERSFSSENEISAPALIVAENVLAEGQKGETGITIVQSDGSDAGDKNICNTSEDCESVTLSNGKQGSNSFDMHALAEHVRKEIERYKYYPDLAKLKGLEGTVYINFYIGQDGTPSSISVARSSGSRILDNAGIKTIGMVGKFSNLHKDLRELDIVVPITYKLVNTDKQ